MRGIGARTVHTPGVQVGVAEGVTVGVAVGVGVGVRVADGEADGVAVAVGDAVGETDGLGVGVASGTTHTPTLVIVSTRHPTALTLLSEAMRKRSLIVCPFTFGPRFATVLR